MVAPEEALSSAYCFISDNKVHCIPINSFQTFSDDYTVDNTSKAHDESDFTPDKLYLKNKNLLYSLNNPSLSDVETDNGVGNSLDVPSQSTLTTPERTRTTSRSPSPAPEDFKITSIANTYSTHAIYLPKLIINFSENLDNDFTELRNLLSKVFPAWTDASKIEFKKLTGGITNALLSCKYEKDRVLIRVYGHGTNLIIDRHREFILHLILNSIHLAPPIFSRFKNGLIYGFLPGRSLEPEELRQESVYPLIAQQLGNWHKNLDYRLIENGVEKLRDFTTKLKNKSKNFSKNGTHKKKPKKKFISNVWELIEEWINIVPINPNLISSFQKNMSIEVNESNLKDIIDTEFGWLKEILIQSNSPTVSSHCDLLSGNVIIPEGFDLSQPLASLPPVLENPIKFIDYEYMLPAPRAFDIANHLAEWQGFACDRAAIPDPTSKNPVLVNWLKGYLNDENALEAEVNLLIEEIATFYGLPGFYWGIWAMIQSEISNIDFNYSKYGEQRLQEYWDWKVAYLKKRQA